MAFVLPPLLVGGIGVARAAQPYLAKPPVISATLPEHPAHDPSKLTAVVVAGNHLTEISDLLGPYDTLATSGKFNEYVAAPERQPSPRSSTPTRVHMSRRCGRSVWAGVSCRRAMGADQGLVAGIDPSVVMLRQARRRNHSAIKVGRVELRRASASDLPFPDQSFDKACAVHSIYFWPSLHDGLRELLRVLVPGGRLVLAVRMRHENASRFDPSR
jgi:SAM-dependent methyltransferase